MLDTSSYTLTELRKLNNQVINEIGKREKETVFRVMSEEEFKEYQSLKDTEFKELQDNGWIDIDEGIIPTLKSAYECGLIPIWSCEGHETEKTSRGNYFGYVSFLANERLNTSKLSQLLTIAVNKRVAVNCDSLKTKDSDGLYVWYPVVTIRASFSDEVTRLLWLESMSNCIKQSIN